MESNSCTRKTASRNNCPNLDDASQPPNAWMVLQPAPTRLFNYKDPSFDNSEKDK